MDLSDIKGVIEKSVPRQAKGDTANSGLTLKERFRRTMFFQDIDVRPNFEFGYWEDTLREWHKQGLPTDITNEVAAYEYFGIENWDIVNVNLGPMPLYEFKILEETEDYVTYRDGNGCIAQINKKGYKSIPHFLDFPIKDRASWEPYKAALVPTDPRRWDGFTLSVEWLRKSTNPVGIFGGSLAGIPRDLIGFQGIAMMQYEDPELLAEIITTFAECALGVLEIALPHIQLDFCMGWEDICFNNGPILTPDFFRRVIGPLYRCIADLLAAHGCCVYTTDCDGNITQIVPIFLDNGLNTMFPVEVNAGTDPVALREKYGKRIRLWGGFCKMKLAASKEAIDKELQRLLPVVEEGGFIPGVDHRVPANVPLDLYKYYLDRKRELFKVGGEPKY